MKRTHTLFDFLTFYGIPILLGVSSFIYFFGVGRILGTGGLLDGPVGDITAHSTGALAYLNSPWQFPIFNTTGINEPDGVNIIFTDSAPFAGLIAKIIATATGLKWNYLGTWFFVVWVGQAFSGAMLMRHLGAKSVVAMACGAALALSFPAFLHRNGHLALSSHFLIVLALAFYFKYRNDADKNLLVRWLPLLIISLFTHAYLFVMVAGIFAASMGDFFYHRKMASGRLAAYVCSALGLVFVAAYVGGYQETLGGGAAGGYGIYVMNLQMLFWPLLSTYFGPHLSILAEHGEGFNYLGVVGLGTIATALVVGYRSLGGFCLHSPSLILCLAIFAGYAVSGNVWWGTVQLTSFQPPLMPPFSIFRVGSRFFWPVGYAVLFGAFAYLARIGMRRYAKGDAVILLAVTFAQVVESKPWVDYMSGLQSVPMPSQVEQAMLDADFVKIVPAWRCVLQSPQESDLVMRLTWVAAKVGTPVNTAQIARFDDVSNCRGSPSDAEGTLTIVLDGWNTEPLVGCEKRDGYSLCARQPAD